MALHYISENELYGDSKASCGNGSQGWPEVFTLLIPGAKALKAVNLNSFLDINMNFTHPELRTPGNDVLRPELPY